jgi:hypothetical protein
MRAQEANEVFAAIDSALKRREERLQAAQIAFAAAAGSSGEQAQQQQQPGAGGSNPGAASQLKRAASKPPLAAPLGNLIGAGREDGAPKRAQPAELPAAAAAAAAAAASKVAAGAGPFLSHEQCQKRSHFLAAQMPLMELEGVFFLHLTCSDSWALPLCSNLH